METGFSLYGKLHRPCTGLQWCYIIMFKWLDILEIFSSKGNITFGSVIQNFQIGVFYGYHFSEDSNLTSEGLWLHYGRPCLSGLQPDWRMKGGRTEEKKNPMELIIICFPGMLGWTKINLIESKLRQKWFLFPPFHRMYTRTVSSYLLLFTGTFVFFVAYGVPCHSDYVW